SRSLTFRKNRSGLSRNRSPRNLPGKKQMQRRHPKSRKPPISPRPQGRRATPGGARRSPRPGRRLSPLFQNLRPALRSLMARRKKKFRSTAPSSPATQHFFHSMARSTQSEKKN